MNRRSDQFDPKKAAKAQIAYCEREEVPMDVEKELVNVFAAAETSTCPPTARADGFAALLLNRQAKPS